MSNLDLTIAEIMHGDTQVLKIMKGDKQKWPYLPYDAEVEYLESDGGAFIDTGIVMQSRNFEIIIKYQWVGSTVNQFETFIGYMSSNSYNMPRSGFHKYNGSWMYGTNVSQVSDVAVDNNIHIARLLGIASSNKEELYIDGNLITTATTSSTGIGGNNLSYYAFARHRPNTFDNPAKARIMNIRVITNNISQYAQTYDFIPVRKNGVGYLYEKVSGELFGNANSTGVFSYGNDV